MSSKLQAISWLVICFMFIGLSTGRAIGNEDGSLGLADRADILIVTSDELADAWKPFADWKTKTGRPAKIVSTDQIEKDFEGTDIQEKIRQCCLKHIDEMSTRFVIIGGDSEGKSGGHVPDRDTDHSKCRMLPYDNIPTDLYFLSKTNWDANDDGVYGSYEDDMEAVTYTNPKACIGRIPVRTTEDVAAYTDKVIAYESEYPVGRFAQRMVYTCPEKNAYPKLETSYEEVTSNWPKGRVDQFFGSRTPWDDKRSGDYDLTPENFTKMINDRDAAKIHIHGHGILPMWVLEKHSKVTASTVAKLENKNAYPIITTVSCLTGQYDDKKDPCITESMIRQPEGGAIAVLAPSREGVPFMLDPANDFRLMVTEGKMDGTTTAYTKFWINALTKNETIGEAFKQVKMEMESDARGDIGFHMLQCELNLLGDPTLDPRPNPPMSFRGRAREKNGNIIARGFAGATLCIWDGEDYYKIVKAAEGNSTTINLDGHTGTFPAAAYGAGYNTWHKNGIKIEAEKEEAESSDSEK